VLPISVDVARIRILLIGEGARACRRLRPLDEAGAKNVEIYAPVPSAELNAAAGQRLRRKLPDAAEIARAGLIFVADMPAPVVDDLSEMAASAGVLLNVEDEPARCDFHSAAVVRRGDLTIAVSTNGRSPGLAAAIRRNLETTFGPDWSDRLDRLAALRVEWQRAGADSRSIADRTAAWLAEQ
jgi:precorrin-2 dehydrogenase/sirohydrochlorin ferrochelatase